MKKHKKRSCYGIIHFVMDIKDWKPVLFVLKNIILVVQAEVVKNVRFQVRGKVFVHTVIQSIFKIVWFVNLDILWEVIKNVK